jgi:hypothetical protein
MGHAGRADYGGTRLWNGGSVKGVGRSGAPRESQQAGISASAGRDSVLRCPAVGILGLVGLRDPMPRRRHSERAQAKRSAPSRAEGRGWSIQRRGLSCAQTVLATVEAVAPLLSFLTSSV